MPEAGRSKWRKLDNAAQVFPSETGKRDTRVFRFYCLLKEEVRKELLQEALSQTMKTYPLFQMVMRKGLFWFYLEQRDIMPQVKKEDKPPCSKLYVPDQKNLLFEVSYCQNRINFEVFHALTDGTGAMLFVKDLVKNYLQLAHPDAALPELDRDLSVTEHDQEEDSFGQYYSSKLPRLKEKKKKAFQIRGERLEQDEMEIKELVLSAGEAVGRARAYGVSLTVYLSALMLWAVHEEVPGEKQHEPVVLMVPVNLRNYYPSRTMANFFGWIEIGFCFQEETTFEEVLVSLKGQFEKELEKELVGKRMNALAGLEKNPVLRAVPLELKTRFLQAGTAFGGKSITAVFSNIGVLKFPEEYHAYIQRFGFFTSTNRLQLCTCSFGDCLTLSFTSRIRCGNIPRNMQKLLEKDGLHVQEEKPEFPGYLEKPKETARTALRTASFLCIAAAVICGMVNYIMAQEISWSGFVAAGSFCTWLVVMTAVYKRRNLLKNGMWQLLIFSCLGVLWDWGTGWRGWSLDYVLPVASLVVLCSMVMIAKIQHLEPAESLIYLVQASVFGWIPLLLLVLGAVKIPGPSVVCAGVSFLFFVMLMIFRQKEMKQEMHKKFRM